MNKGWALMPRSTDNSPRRDRRIAKKEKPMCPVCIATAALIAGKVTSSAGAAAIAIRKVGKNAGDHPVQLNLNRSEDEQSVPNSNPRRDEDVNDHD
jgi:hypothetical protein